MQQRIGIVSGTFDPVHMGHVAFALDAITQAKLDRVYFMVERNPRRKQGVKAYEHRQAMVQLAIKNQPMLGSIITEQDRFTAQDTLPVLKARFGAAAKLALLMGDDMLSHLADWPDVEKLLKAADFVVGARGDAAAAEQRLQLIQEVRGISFNYNIFNSNLSSASSTAVRRAVRKTGTSKHLDPLVQDYIIEHKLYASSDDENASSK